MITWERRHDGKYVFWETDVAAGKVEKWGDYWATFYGAVWWGNFKTLKRAQAWVEHIATA